MIVGLMEDLGGTSSLLVSELIEALHHFCLRLSDCFLQFFSVVSLFIDGEELGFLGSMSVASDVGDSSRTLK